MKKYNDDLAMEIVAKGLTDGSTEYEDIENFEEIITGLQFIMVDEGITQRVKSPLPQVWDG